MAKNKIKYVKWLLFTGVITVLPIGLNLTFQLLSQKTIELSELIGNGQLLLVSCALSASGLGEIFSSADRNSENFMPRVIAGFVGIVFLLLSSSIYGYVSGIAGDKMDMDLFIKIQFLVFTASFLVGLYAQKYA